MDFRIRYQREQRSPEQKAREAHEESDALRRSRMLALGLSIPMTLLSGPLAGWLLGSWIDRSFGTAFWGFTLLLLGVLASLSLVVRQLSIMGR